MANYNAWFKISFFQDSSNGKSIDKILLLVTL